MRITKRLRLNVAITVTMALFIFLALFLALYQIKKALYASEITSGITNGALERITLRNDYLRNYSERASAQWLDKFAEINRLDRSAVSAFHAAEDRKAVEALINVHESIGNNFLGLVENVERREENASSLTLFRKVEDRLLSQLNMRVSEEIMLARTLRESARAHLFFVLKLSAGGILSAFLIILMAVTINARTLGRAITDRINRLRNGATVIGDGDLDHRIDIKGDDEFVELAETFNAMTAKLSGSYHALEKEMEERKRTEEALQGAHDTLAQQMKERTRELREKEVLLKEIHHRVKNNLQVISSLVSLQADSSEDETMRQGLRDVTYRVRSMALVHEKLYQSADLARINFAEYTSNLLHYLWRSHGGTAAHIGLTLNLEPLVLPVDIAVPCGLILNELAGNTLKHAFQGHSEGQVIVSLQEPAMGHVCLRVGDNGVGLPAGFDWQQTGTLGLRLVQMLAGQLDAVLEVHSEEGTEVAITFEYPR